jgi:chemotaxis protein CheD
MMVTPGTLPRIYLKPGEFHFAVTPSIVSTVLGSCISVTMHNPESTMGAICHAVLPDEFVPGEPYRYVDSSIAAMLRLFDRYRINRKDIQVKLFGGSDILPKGENGYRYMTVGQQNILRANQIIEREQLRLIASDVGGTRGRKLLFHTHSGEIYLQRLRDNTR